MIAAWHNLRSVTESELMVPAFGSLALHGEGLFDTLRIHEGRPIGLAQHRARTLEASLRCWGPSLDLEVLIRDTYELLETQLLKVDSAVARVLVTPSASGSVDVFAQVRAWSPPSEERYRQGVRLGISVVPHPGCGRWGKTTNTFWSHEVAREARARDLDELLVLRDGRVVECAWSSVLWLQRGRWHGIEPSEGGVPSTTIELLKAKGLEVVPTTATPTHLEEGDAIVLVSALRLVIGVRSLGGTIFSAPDRAAAPLRALLLEPDHGH